MRSIHTLGFVLVAALASAALTSCGGGGGNNGGGSNTLSVLEFHQQADAICSAFLDEIDALGEPPTTPDAFLSYLRKLLPISEEGHRQLRQLVPPDNLAETWNRGLAANDEVDEALRDLQDALEEGDLSSARASELITQIQTKGAEAGNAARELGLDECGGEQETTAQPPAPPTEPLRTVYEDDFSQRRSLWPDDTNAGYAQGGFRLRVEDADSGLVIPHGVRESVTRLRIDVDARQTVPGTGQRHGFSCLLGEGPGYTFWIQPDKRLWRISTYGTTDHELASDAKVAAVRPAPATNHLRGVCALAADAEVRLTLFVNGRQVGEASDSSSIGSLDSLALNLDSGQARAEVVFDDLTAQGA